jgi:hypothetical protein
LGASSILSTARDLLIEVCVRHFDEGLGNIHTGIVDEHIEALETRDLRTDFIATGEVADEDVRPASAGSDPLRNLLEVFARSAH